MVDPSSHGRTRDDGRWGALSCSWQSAQPRRPPFLEAPALLVRPLMLAYDFIAHFSGPSLVVQLSAISFSIKLDHSSLRRPSSRRPSSTARHGLGGPPRLECCNVCLVDQPARATPRLRCRVERAQLAGANPRDNLIRLDTKSCGKLWGGQLAAPRHDLGSALGDLGLAFTAHRIPLLRENAVGCFRPLLSSLPGAAKPATSPARSRSARYGP